jgi:hypothetical protein
MRSRRPSAQESATADVGAPVGAPADASGETDDPQRPDAGGSHGGRRRTAATVGAVLAALLVFVVLSSPIEVTRLTPAEFVRIPVELLLVLALLLVLPPRPRRWVATLFGVLLGLLALTKILDLGFLAVLARPFDPALDWILFDDAAGFLTDSIGRIGAIAVVVLVAAIALGVPVLMVLAMRRLARLLARHRIVSTRGVAAGTAAWAVCAVFGTQLVAGVPIADNNSSVLVYDRALKVRAGVADQEAFEAEARVDQFRNTPGDQLLTALRGKDVLVAFVESYGRDAVEDPVFAPEVGATLDAGTSVLAAAGFGSRSAYLTSPTSGAGSGLAHATLASGLWIDSNQRWRKLVSSDRQTLTKTFQRAGWRTVGVMPGNTWAWPEADFYGFEKIYDSRNVGYRGPAFSWATMPDQYALSAFERDEFGKPGHPALLTEIHLVSSHAPWAPLPRMVDWGAVGDGSIFTPMATQGDPADVIWSDPDRVRTEYRRSIQYSLDSLISFVQTYGNDNTVLLLLGDHQPLPIVTGEGASRDVPITIIAHDQAVLDRMSGWGWQQGMKPGPQSPVWKMDAFRDRFLTTFGPQGDPVPAPQAH